MICYCLGIRLDRNYNEVTCRVREQCGYYRNNDLSEFMSHPDEYIELDTYNNSECEYEKLCEQKTNSNLQGESDSSDSPIFGR